MPVLWCKRVSGNGKAIGLFPGCTRSNNTKEGPRARINITLDRDEILALPGTGIADGNGNSDDGGPGCLCSISWCGFSHEDF